MPGFARDLEHQTIRKSQRQAFLEVCQRIGDNLGILDRQLLVVQQPFTSPGYWPGLQVRSPLALPIFSSPENPLASLEPDTCFAELHPLERAIRNLPRHVLTRIDVEDSYAFASSGTNSAPQPRA